MAALIPPAAFITNLQSGSGIRIPEEFLKQQIARKNRLLKIVQNFPVTPYGGIFEQYLNPTPIAELSVETAAELTPTTGPNVGLPTGDKISTGIRPGFGMFDGGSESPDDAIE